jgi:F-type H+-transporting ATPase subunit alpha
MQLLVQPQYQPLPLSEQVAVIYLGTHGYADDIEAQQVARLGREAITFVRQRHPNVLRRIQETGQLTEEVERELKEALEDFRRQFQAGPAQPAEKGESA